MTTEDLSNAIRVFFSHRKIKLFKNEPHKKLLGGEWRVIRNLGYPAGSPDLIGWRISDGKTCGVELKTLNDNIKKEQTKFLNLMIHDNCLTYIAKELENGNIDLQDWKTKEKEIIYVR